jgi:hypothetical protein
MPEVPGIQHCIADAETLQYRLDARVQGFTRAVPWEGRAFHQHHMQPGAGGGYGSRRPPGTTAKDQQIAGRRWHGQRDNGTKAWLSSRRNASRAAS